MDKILLMIQLQNQLNDATNGEKWTEGITKNGKVINWKRCIYMECAEMVDSFAWKHWKNIDQEPNWDNLQIEVVDVWHFIISLAIEEYSKNLRGGLEELALDITQSFDLNQIDTKKAEFGSQEEILKKVEDIMCLALDKENFDLEKLLGDFFELVTLSNLNLNTLYKLYVGKNILNQFRQDNGYKDGTYIKMWNGVEDNAIMQEIWKENENIDPNQLYKELTKRYIALTKNEE
ncbi:Dimeric dUTPase [hydrothermal vent metagenome]|uniref:Dimeric dUTPase n=1 Tax=hydrothermal vent metagenome TaxID=652676 RepID=A0A1W1D5F3_9ZZZZ